jgi:hypothetical protein
MGHIANLSSLGQYINILSNIKYAFHFPNPTLGGNYFNQLIFSMSECLHVKFSFSGFIVLKNKISK